MNVKLTTTVCFSDALRQMKLGYPIQRAGWNGKGLWVRLFKKNDLDGGNMTMDYAFITYPDGNTCPWVPSQSDMLAEDWTINFEEEEIPLKKGNSILKDIVQLLNDGYRARHKSWGPDMYIQRHPCLLDKVVYAGSEDEEVDLNDFFFFESGAWEISRSHGQYERADIEFHEITMYLNNGYIVRQQNTSFLSHLLYDKTVKVCRVRKRPDVGLKLVSISEINPDPSAYPRSTYRWEAFKKGQITK